MPSLFGVQKEQLRQQRSSAGGPGSTRAGAVMVMMVMMIEMIMVMVPWRVRVWCLNPRNHREIINK